jgi:hypothetical protein
MNNYRNSWDRDNFYYHRTDPKPWLPIDEPIRFKSTVKSAIKTVLVALLFSFVVGYISNARAEVLAQTGNNLGGKIVITDVKCTTGAGYVAYSTNPKGETLLGCWVHDDSFIHILWNNSNNPNSYPYNGWVMSKKIAPSI